MFRHILVPTDGSELSQAAIHQAVSFAKSINARVTFFYAKPEFPVTFYVEGVPIDAPTSEKFSQRAEFQAQEFLGLGEKLAKEAGVECSKVTVSSDIPYEAIIDAANEQDCDLIFMASHGRRGISGFLLGSETNSVLTHSKVPVLVYR